MLRRDEQWFRTPTLRQEAEGLQEDREVDGIAKKGLRKGRKSGCGRRGCGRGERREIMRDVQPEVSGIIVVSSLSS